MLDGQSAQRWRRDDGFYLNDTQASAKTRSRGGREGYRYGYGYRLYDGVAEKGGSSTGWGEGGRYA
jgi:hypothetical protein